MRNRRPALPVQANMTSLIDVVFLLIVFFVLVSRIVDEDRPRLDLPSPRPPATVVAAIGPRAVISVVPSEANTARYHLAGRYYPADKAGRAAIGSVLTDMLARNARTAIQIRAGRDTPWNVVAPLLDEAREAGTRAALQHPVRVQLAAIRERGV
ncbi:MAG: biopolymer transporter ExbD [Phycisphaerales bacterium]|nr:biopolymer transporter ExbD [Phycisphaerales bacterium]MDP7520246.1 biopolymer transporter ExbD [Phycisphaerales bacterium]